MWGEEVKWACNWLSLDYTAFKTSHFSTLNPLCRSCHCPLSFDCWRGGGSSIGLKIIMKGGGQQGGSHLERLGLEQKSWWLGGPKVAVLGPESVIGSRLFNSGSMSAEEVLGGTLLTSE